MTRRVCKYLPIASGRADSSARLPSGRHELPRDVVVESQRDRIMQALAETIAERGYAATTIAAVVERARVSSATFYEIFRSKDDCLAAVANTTLGEIVTVVTSQYSPDKPLFQVNRDAVAAVLALMAQRPALAKLVFVEGRTATAQTRQTYMSGVNVLVSLLDQLRVDGPSNAETPASTARAAVGAAEGLIRNEILSGRTATLPKILPEVTYAILVPFLGREEALKRAEEARQHPPEIELMPFGRAHL